MPTMLVLGPADHGRTLTREEFETARGQEGFRYELVYGKVYVTPLPNLPHYCVLKWLERQLEAFAAKAPQIINYVATQSRVFVPGQDEPTTPEPDLAGYRDFPLDVPVARRNWQKISPVLVVEIVSEDDPDKDLVRNVELYIQVPSIREYWIIDPRFDAERPPLRIYRRRGRRWQAPLNIPGGDVYNPRLLPGFRLTLNTEGA